MDGAEAAPEPGAKERPRPTLEVKCMPTLEAFFMDEWRSRISVDPKVLVGKPVIKSTRISVELVVGLLARGNSIEAVLGQYEHITRDDVLACLAYAADILGSESVLATPS